MAKIFTIIYSWKLGRFFFFFLGGICELGGGYQIWLWLKTSEFIRHNRVGQTAKGIFSPMFLENLWEDE